MRREDPGPPGGRIKAAREAAGFTQRRLAAAAGISTSMVAALEQGRARNPTLATLRKVAGALGVPVAELLKEE